VIHARGTETRGLALFVGLLAALACDGSGSNGMPQVGAAPDPGGAMTQEALARPLTESVETSRVRRGAVTAVVTASGSIVARRTTPLGPAVAGRLVRVDVDVGDEVAEGDPIFLIDAEPYRIGLEAAEAGLEVAVAQLKEAEDDAERIRKLAKKEMVSQQNYDRARTRAAVARAQVQQAKSQRSQAKNDLERTLVRAPYNASVVDRLADEGTMATVVPNTTVVVLQETSALEAVLDIPESSLALVRVGDRARLYVEGVAEPFESTVQVVSNRIDLATRTYEVRVPVTDPNRRLKGGAFVRGEVVPSKKESVLLVGRSALTTQDGRTFAFRVSEGRAERVPVRLGVVGAEEAEILHGLLEGDEVVVGSVVTRLADGMRLETRPTAGSETTASSADVAASPPQMD
jgi:HlyD family secretion protein